MKKFNAIIKVEINEFTYDVSSFGKVIESIESLEKCETRKIIRHNMNVGEKYNLNQDTTPVVITDKIYYDDYVEYCFLLNTNKKTEREVLEEYVGGCEHVREYLDRIDPDNIEKLRNVASIKSYHRDMIKSKFKHSSYYDFGLFDFESVVNKLFGSHNNTSLGYKSLSFGSDGRSGWE